MLWAYGTSPHGLGLSDSDFWLLSPREFCALEDVQQSPLRVYANGTAILINLQLSSEAEPFIADDLLGCGDRGQRVLDRKIGDAEAKRENSRLQKMKKGDPAPADLPSWAL